MISFSSVWAITLRHARLYKSDYSLLLSVFYWPLLDIIIWGFLGAWIARANVAQFNNYETAALLGILLWQVVGRGCNILGFTLAVELWGNNQVNLFSMPLRLREWMLGVIIFSFITMLATCFFGMFAIKMLYSLSVLYILKTFFIFLLPLFLCTLWLGFSCISVFLLLGHRGIEVGFILGWVLMPFSGAYYPIDILPSWAQKVSALLPMSYLFNGMREYVMLGENPISYILIGTLLGIIYAGGAMMLFSYCFNHSKRNGLARLTD